MGYVHLISKEKGMFKFKKMEGVNVMELDIQEKLEEIYKYVLCKVEFIDFRQYKITIELDYLTTKELKGELIYKYDAKSSFDYNITQIEQMIDRKIVNLLKGE